MQRILLLLMLVVCGWSADKSPLVLDATNRPTPIQPGDRLRLPIAGPFYTTFAPSATADRVLTLPNATTTLAGLGVTQTFTAPQTISDTLTVTGNGISTYSGSFAGDYLLKVTNANATGLGLRVQAGADGNNAIAVRNAAGATVTWLVNSGGSMSSGQINPTTSNTHSLGTSALRWADGYFGGNVHVHSGAASLVRLYGSGSDGVVDAATGNLLLQSGSGTKVTITNSLVTVNASSGLTVNGNVVVDRTGATSTFSLRSDDAQACELGFYNRSGLGIGLLRNASSTNLVAYATAPAANVMTLTNSAIGAGSFTVAYTTPSTSATTGSIITPGGLGVGGSIWTSSTVNAALLELRAGSAGAYAIKTRATGDAAERFGIEGQGRMWWGDGTAAVDTNLYRNSASVLKTDDAFIAAGITSTAGGAFAGQVALTGTTTSINMDPATGSTFESGVVNVASNYWYVYDATAGTDKITVRGGASGVITLYGPTSLPDSTASTSAGTGALVITGGLGVTGRINTNSYIRSLRTTNGDRWFEGGDDGDSFDARIVMSNTAAGGAISFGPGTAALDTFLERTGAGTFKASALTGNSIVLDMTSAGSSNAEIKLNRGGSGQFSRIQYIDATGTKYNWVTGVQINVDNTFEITPSTAAGGSTYTTPALKIPASTGIVFLGSTTTPGTPSATEVQAGNGWLRAGTALGSEISMYLKDGVTAPSTVAGYGFIYIDTADGDLKIKFGDGTVRTIVAD